MTPNLWWRAGTPSSRIDHVPARHSATSLIRISLCLLALFAVGDHRAMAGRLTPSSDQQAPSVETIGKVTDFFEWALNIRFTAEQRSEYAAMLRRDWSNEAQRNSTEKLLAIISKAESLPPEKRRAAQAQLESILVAGLRERTTDPESTWILGIYQATHPGTPSSSVESNSAAPATVEDGRVIGKWRATHVAATQYENSYTGAPAPTSGSSFAYEFRTDGSYSENGTLQVTTYGCTSAVFQDNSGRYRLEAGRLILQPERGIVKSQTCGGPEKEKAADLSPRTYAYKLEAGNGGETLIVQDVEGKNLPDYYRRER